MGINVCLSSVGQRLTCLCKDLDQRHYGKGIKMQTKTVLWLDKWNCVSCKQTENSGIDPEKIKWRKGERIPSDEEDETVQTGSSRDAFPVPH